MVSHIRNINKLLGMYIVIVAERNKPVTFDVPVLLGSANTCRVQRRVLEQGLLVHTVPTSEVNELPFSPAPPDLCI